MSGTDKETMKGLAYGASAFIIWGLLPLYWQQVKALDAWQLFSHRVVWSFLFIVVLMVCWKQLAAFKSFLKDKTKLTWVTGSAVFISINWLVYIWAVNHGRIVESSLGYFMNPLVLTVFGVVFFKERIGPFQMMGIALAAVGVTYKTIMFGNVPWVALVLAVSFAIYGVLKKQAGLDSLTSLAMETLIIGMPALAYLMFVETGGIGITGNLSWHFWVLIALSGIATATPLLLYAESAKRLPLYALGFLQYISPSIALLLGVLVYGEPFKTVDFISFGCIWSGLAFFSYAQLKVVKSAK